MITPILSNQDAMANTIESHIVFLKEYRAQWRAGKAYYSKTTDMFEQELKNLTKESGILGEDVEILEDIKDDGSDEYGSIMLPTFAVIGIKSGVCYESGYGEPKMDRWEDLAAKNGRKVSYV